MQVTESEALIQGISLQQFKERILIFNDALDLEAKERSDNFRSFFHSSSREE